MFESSEVILHKHSKVFLLFEGILRVRGITCSSSIRSIAKDTTERLESIDRSINRLVDADGRVDRSIVGSNGRLLGLLVGKAKGSPDG